MLPEKKQSIVLDEIGNNYEFSLNEYIYEQEKHLNIEKNKPDFLYNKIDISDASESIIFEQDSNKFIIAIYGPKEMKQRSKMKNEECLIDLIIKFNYDFNRDRIKYLQGLLINYTESLIFTEEYPRCQITIVINVISFYNESNLLSTLFNGIMLALSTSGIDLKVFALSVCLEKDLIISLDANNTESMLYMDSSEAIDSETFTRNLSLAKDKVINLYNQFKSLLIKNLLKR